MKITFQISISCPEIEKILRLQMPGPVFLVKRSQGEDGMLNFVLDLPVASASDVVSRIVKVQIADGAVSEFALGAADVVTPELQGADGAAVIGSLVDVDDAGNVSPAREFSFVLVDTIAPAQPGEISLRVTSEV